MVELQTSHHTGTKIFNENIGRRNEAANGFHALRRFQIEHTTVLADIELAERGAAVVAHGRTGSHRLAFSGFDLDDLRAHVGQHAGAMRPGNRGGEIEHPQAGKAPCQIPLIVFRYCHLWKLLAPSRPVRVPARRDPSLHGSGREVFLPEARLTR